MNATQRLLPSLQGSTAPWLPLSYPSHAVSCYCAVMALDATARRRWLGAIALVVALTMLVCGETLLKEKLGNLTFVCYWLVCFGFTGLAILVALLDARALRRRTSQEHLNLFETTLQEIQTDAKNRRRPRGHRRGGPQPPRPPAPGHREGGADG